MQTLESPPQASAGTAADADITAAIKRCYLTKRGVAPHLIEVSTKAGIVELTGATNSLLSRHRAEEIALAVCGVRGVVNELVVNGPDVPSPELHQHVQQALADDPVARDYNLRCTVSDGMVWLTGTVRSWAEKQLALRVVEGVRGVQHIVDDQLRVCREGPPKSDADLTRQLLEALDWDIRVNRNLVQVRTADRMVHLAGTVGSLAVKRRIEGLAYELGASRVDGRDLLVARWALGPGMGREEDLDRSDEAIAQAVRDTFDRDPRLREELPQVEVQAHAGAVTLRGTVGNLRACRSAAHDAGQVAGVREVHNLLKVRPTRFWSDADLRQRVAAALQRDPYLHGFHFSVTVLNSRATLHGWVSSRFEQEQAGELASGVNGVVDVENRVAVWPDGHHAAQALAGHLTGSLRPAEKPLPAAELVARIRARYAWSVWLHNQPIDVRVEEGESRVTLTGAVDTAQARELAVREAYEQGATEVDNHLRVCPTPEKRTVLSPTI
ncbi:BON domain-containing protein [Hymenobacter armeniacus]|uniref:BON domain-containing protein n=1 Tax=Hymenobacter armeniacus TaxID=2771358 RepID=A0ABR8JPP9_9BACT|nr:BON domain-containing protein [Hymenobacter armeniacus]MBD2721040.1 BON domain-containing protein [Hymenobacter armeniacus]